MNLQLNRIKIASSVQNCPFTCTEGAQESFHQDDCMTIVQVAQKTDRDCRLLSMYTADHSVLKQKKEKNDDDDVDDNDSDSDGSDC